MLVVAIKPSIKAGLFFYVYIKDKKKDIYHEPCVRDASFSFTPIA